MAARAEMLGDTGVNHPDHWVGGLASPDLHAIVILFARDDAERVRCVAGAPEARRAMRRRGGALDARPGGDAAVRLRPRSLRLPRPAVAARASKGPATCRRPAPAPRSSRASSSSATPTRTARPPNLPQPEILSRNGSYLAYRRLQEHVGAFRDFLRQHGKTPEEQELVAAKLMGRWRSGAPLVLAPDKDDPALGADMQRNNDFNYKEMDPHGYAVPLGSHIRRMNPRDTAREHEPAPDDSPRRHLRPAACRRARPRTASSAASPPS